MDALIQAIKKGAANADEFEKLVKKLEANTKIMKKNLGAIDTALATEQVHPVQHTFGYALLLAVKAGSDFKNHNEFIDQARSLLSFGEEEQFRRAAKHVAVVSRKLVTSLALAGDKWLRGVQPLRDAALRLQTEQPNLLTPVHSDFLYVCLKAKMYSYALPVVEVPMYEIDPKTTGLEPLDFLTYFYYAGMIHIGLKQFPKALEAFQLGLTIPSMMLSAVHVECFKKYVLCSLIVHGELQRLPEKTTSHVVSRNVDRICPAYLELSRAYRRGVEEMYKCLEANQDIFKKDRNLGLVRQTVQACVRNNISRLTKTYVTLSLSDLAAQANLGNPAQAEKILLTMIEEGQIFASINQKDGMISFLEDPEEYDTSGMAQELDQKIQEVIDLSQELQTRDRDLQLNQQYLIKTNPGMLAAAAAGPGERGGGGGGLAEDEMMARAMEASLMSH